MLRRLATTDDVTTAFEVMNKQRGRDVTDDDVAAAVASLGEEERAALVTECSLFKDCFVYVHGMRSDGSVSTFDCIAVAGQLVGSVRLTLAPILAGDAHSKSDILLLSALPRTAFQVAVYGGTVLDTVQGECVRRAVRCLPRHARGRRRRH